MMQKIKYTLFLLSLFRKEGIGTKVYLCVRMLIFPFAFLGKIQSFFEKSSGILDIGCGYGISSFYPVFLRMKTRVCWLDFDEKRIRKLTHIVESKDFPNLSFFVRDLMKEGFQGLEWYDTALLVDVLHHIDQETQSELLKFLSGHTKNILIKDIDITPRYKYYWNFFHDRYLMNNKVLCFQGSAEIKRILENLWYSVRYEKIASIFPYPHFLLIASKE